ncbi:ring-cleaving dioxygenase [Paenibacillus flagellatus]|uniref:Ring-cleaving dioxygenase n=1 Tax=Paenibacillus flagellatus TaxID=2211139 RepID=A0A2V5K2Y5_9BACL|nr:ring-cleaving dioxygenase [Paenibacillus flagellatus]PYI53551.1 ring-cleaving dioxygenase [Paenibacillus flagellatus]
MALRTAGIHHITAFASDPQANVDFYAGVLGLRLVKKTVNFDAPEVYHLYFGNENGSPGTIITFFPFPGARRGRVGGGQVGYTTFVVPPGSLGFWESRLKEHGVSVSSATRFAETFLQFADNEGMRLELVEREEGPNSGWSFGGVPAEMAIKGFGGAVLYSTNAAQTTGALEHALGLSKVGEENGYARFRATGDRGNVIDVPLRDMEWGRGGAGTVHHIAWRAKDFDEHAEWRTQVGTRGYEVTPILDRQYFNAVYFREGGGILFEIATDPPGFARDERPEELGERLMLPDWYEPQRETIEANLLPIRVRSVEVKAE